MKNAIWLIILTFVLVPSGMKGKEVTKGGYPDLEVITKNLFFGNVLIGNELIVPVKLKNIGTFPLIISEININVDSTVFTVVNPPTEGYPIIIRSDKTKEILIKFKPLELEVYKSEMIIISDDYNYNGEPVKLEGNAIDDPIVTTDWDFGTVELNKVHNQYIYIQNISSHDITIDSLYYEKGTKEFHWNNFPDFNYPISVPAGEDYPIFIQFEASEEGYYQESIIIKSTPSTKQTCQVMGTAIDINTSVQDITDIESLSFQSIDGGSEITFAIISESVFEDGTFAIYSQEGKLIKSQFVNGNSTELSVSISKKELPKLSFIRLTQGERVYTQNYVRE